MGAFPVLDVSFARPLWTLWYALSLFDGMLNGCVSCLGYEFFCLCRSVRMRGLPLKTKPCSAGMFIGVTLVMGLGIGNKGP